MDPHLLAKPFAVAAGRALRFLRRPPRWLWFVLVLAAVEFVYVFIITAGTFTNWPTWNAFYDLQAEGFRSGHLYLPAQPSPALLAKPNPFDYSNRPLWFWDASLYKGRYYFYWGPVPGLLLAAVKTVFRVQAVIGDQFLVLFGYTLLLVVGALFIDRVARRIFPSVPLSLVLLAVVVFGLASPTLYLIATPGVYEAAIAWAQAFLVLGLLLAFDAIWDKRDRPSGWRLALAGLSWAIAIACRAIVGPVAVVLGLATVIVLWRRHPGRWRGLLRHGILIATPAVLIVVGLLAYNKARFDSWWEFGVTYQLNTVPFLTSKAFVPLNLWSYSLRPLAWSCQFPFVEALYEIGKRGFPRALVMPAQYSTHEPLAGLLVTTPWAWLAAAAVPVVVLRIRRWWRHERVDGMSHGGRASLWVAGCLAALASVTLLPLINGNTTTMRYLADVVSGVVVLGIWAVFALFEAASGRRWARWSLVAVCVGLAIATVLLSLLLGFQGYDGMFGKHNPALYARLQRALSLCASR